MPVSQKTERGVYMDAEQKRTEPEKILIVDDIEVNVKILENIMKREGYDTLCAQSVQEALEIMNETMPQLILSDYSMPGMNGLEFCRLLKSTPITRDIPFIIITVADSSEEKRQAFEAGVVDFIGKPFEPVEVIMRVNNQINSYHIKQELENYNRLMHKMVTEQKKHLDQERENVLLALARVAEKRSPYSKKHFDRVCQNAHLLAQSMQLLPQYEDDVTEEFVETIGTATRLCDVGNILFPEGAFPFGSAEDEYDEDALRFQTEEGAKFLEEIDPESDSVLLNMAVVIARYHHAHWDGSGVPRGTGGEDIPLEARITAIVNDFDALHSTQDDGESRSVDECLEIINGRSGSVYDARIVEIFDKVVRQMRV